MTARLGRTELVRELEDRWIAVEEAKEDPRLRGVDLEAADLDEDGKIAGDEEASALFDAIDRRDRDGDADSLRLRWNGGWRSTGAAVAAVGDLAEADGLRRRAADAREAGARPNDDVFFVGLNPSNRFEAEELSRRARVTYRPASQPGLESPEEIAAFVDGLGLPPQQAADVREVLQSSFRAERVPLAQLAQEWARAERGAATPSRLVLSGHGSGLNMWGGTENELRFTSIARLAAALPAGAARVEDLHVASCYSATSMSTLQIAFPNLRTLWTYRGSAPGSGSGAVAHQRVWERATRGRADSIDPARLGTARKAENVAVWSERTGTVERRPRPPVERLERDHARLLPTLQSFARGASEVADPHNGPLRFVYDRIQEILQHPDTTPERRRELESEKQLALRLLFFRESVAPRFAREHTRAIDAGFRAVGLEAPDFARLGRRETLAAIAGLERAAEARRPVPAATGALLRLLHRGLRDLDPDVIPDGWIG
ncbi:MAG: hypothetical protein HYY06_30685 [Deltaproteobacteria bacterium]|nr:hypothetical protein [Deltaproteobacteria bacterium]